MFPSSIVSALSGGVLTCVVDLGFHFCLADWPAACLSVCLSVSVCLLVFMLPACLSDVDRWRSGDVGLEMSKKEV